jgi:hypothetical protein
VAGVRWIVGRGMPDWIAQRPEDVAESTPYGVIVTETETETYISFRLPSWLTVEERARIKSGLDEWWAANVVNSSGARQERRVQP